MQLAARNRLTGVEHEVLEEPHLRRGDPGVVGAAGDAARETIQKEVPDGDLLTDTRARTPADECANTGAQLVVGDRFYDEVIRSRVEPAHDRLAVALPGIQHYRRPAAGTPQLLEYLEPVSVAKMEIEDDSIVVVHECKRSRLLAGRSKVDGVCLAAQDAFHEVENGVVIVDRSEEHT